MVNSITNRSVLTTVLTVVILLTAPGLSLAQTQPDFALQIEWDEGVAGDGVLQGQEVAVDINISENGAPLSQFAVVISYPKDNLYFTGLSLDNSVLVHQCGWDEIVAEVLDFEDTSSTCPKGYIAIHGTADFGRNNIDDDNCAATGSMFSLRFMLSNDRTLECQFLPVRFAFVNCQSNLLWLRNDGVVWADEPVEDPSTGEVSSPCGGLSGPSNPGDMFPTEIEYPQVCIDNVNQPPAATLSLTDGGVQIICAGEIDGRGDFNLDGIGFTIVDRTLFEDYLLYGESSLPDWLMDQPSFHHYMNAAADINDDGDPFTVADFVQLIRVINGGPYPAFDQPSTTIRFEISRDGTLLTDQPIGGVYLTLEGEAQFEVLDDHATWDSHFRPEDSLTYLLIYSEDGQSIENPVVRAHSPVVSVDLSTPEGNPTLAVESDLLPAGFVLYQNYPNPFNPTTTIEFALPIRADYQLTIFNAQGQQVETRQGRAEAGVTQIEWDGADYASGVYLYKIEALGTDQSRKMLLVK